MGHTKITVVISGELTEDEVQDLRDAIFDYLDGADFESEDVIASFDAKPDVGDETGACESKSDDIYDKIAWYVLDPEDERTFPDVDGAEVEVEISDGGAVRAWYRDREWSTYLLGDPILTSKIKRWRYASQAVSIMDDNIVWHDFDMSNPRTFPNVPFATAVETIAGDVVLAQYEGGKWVTYWGGNPISTSVIKRWRYQ